MLGRVALTAVVGLLALPAASHAETVCGTTSIRKHEYTGQYQLVRLRTGVSCATVRRVGKRYLREQTATWPWACVPVHEKQPNVGTVHPVAQCARRGRTMVELRSFEYDVDGASAAAAAEKDCGLTKRIDGVGYQVFISRGSYPCAPTKRVVYRYLVSGRVDVPWDCHHTHGPAARIYFVACRRYDVRVHVVAPG